MAANIEYFNNSQGVQAETIKFITNISSPAGPGPLEKLEARIAAGAIHDSDERCDAPKCHPLTRVAVQDDLYDWIIDGDRAESEHPRKIKWVTGPAGSGKTAVMGSLADRCAANGVLGATFFFASWSASVGRRRKTAFVTTIACQLAEYREDLKSAISKAIEKNPRVFEKNLRVQMETLVLAPVREVTLQSERPRLQGAIIIDGLDECEAEQYYDTTTTGTKFKSPPPRTNEQDQLEILQALRAASSDPSFPFRILIASRPERVFREFFNPGNSLIPFAHKLDLNEEYNADADIALFLEVNFYQIRRRYNLPPSWPLPGTIQTLVENASGQFIYAATVIRFLTESSQAHPDNQLQLVLARKWTTTSNPFEPLDELYSHIVASSPEPALVVRWIHGIDKLDWYVGSAYHINLFFETKPGEAEHLLGSLHSLIWIPHPSNLARAKYSFYHKSLLDFLRNPDRCGKLHIQYEEIEGFIWDQFNGACARGGNTHFSYLDPYFLDFLARFPEQIFPSVHSTVVPTLTPAGADWWVSLAIAHKYDYSLWYVFRKIHKSCRWYRCNPACKIWSRSILRGLGSATWKAPGVFWPARSLQEIWFDDLVETRIQNHPE